MEGGHHLFPKMDPDDISQCISLVYGIKCPQCCCYFFFLFLFFFFSFSLSLSKIPKKKERKKESYIVRTYVRTPLRAGGICCDQRVHQNCKRNISKRQNYILPILGVCGGSEILIMHGSIMGYSKNK